MSFEVYLSERYFKLNILEEVPKTMTKPNSFFSIMMISKSLENPIDFDLSA